MDKPTSEKDVIKELSGFLQERIKRDDERDAKIKELEASLQKAHINNAYYIGRCGELEAENERLNWELSDQKRLSDKWAEAYKGLDISCYEAFKKLDKVREYCEGSADLYGRVNSEEILDLIK
jgi:phage host-nuclease inhibitor protein Gam